MAPSLSTSKAAMPKPHNSDLALQKYLLLQSQHETLREHLNQMRALAYSTTAATSTSTSPAVSPTRELPSSKRHHSRSSRRLSLPPNGHRDPRRRSTLEPVLDETTLYEMAEEERHLLDVNEGIKRALTELLNCEVVQADRPLRTWVQSRLMENEKELRCDRRRRSTAAYA